MQKKIETDRILYTRDGKEFRGTMLPWGETVGAQIGIRVVLAYETSFIPLENISRIQVLYGATDDEE